MFLPEQHRKDGAIAWIQLHEGRHCSRLMKDLYVVIPCRQACDAELSIGAYVRSANFPADNGAQLHDGSFDGSAPLVYRGSGDFDAATERTTIVFDVDVDLAGAGSCAAHDLPATHFHVCPK